MGGQLVIEALMLVVLLWSRPYNRKPGNWINIVIQVVRVVSVVCILIFVNSIISCCKENPHRKRRKAAKENLSQDIEGDAFLMTPNPYTSSPSRHTRKVSDPAQGYEPMRANAFSRFGPRPEESQETLVKGAAGMGYSGYRSLSHGRSDPDGSPPPPFSREPRLPDLAFEQYRHK